LSTTEAGTPVLDPSGYPHTDGDTTQLWVDGPAVPPPPGGGLVGLELVLLAVLVGGGVVVCGAELLWAELLEAELLWAAVLVGAVVVGLTVVLVGVGVLVGAVEVGRIGGRWYQLPPLMPCRQGPAGLAWCWLSCGRTLVLAATAWLPSSNSPTTPASRTAVRAGPTPSLTGLPCRGRRDARCLTEDIGRASLRILVHAGMRSQY
jgi:hypothetical protein